VAIVALISYWDSCHSFDVAVMLQILCNGPLYTHIGRCSSITKGIDSSCVRGRKEEKILHRKEIQASWHRYDLIKEQNDQAFRKGHIYTKSPSKGINERKRYAKDPEHSMYDLTQSVKHTKHNCPLKMEGAARTNRPYPMSKPRACLGYLGEYNGGGLFE